MAQSVVDDQGVYKTTCGYCKSGARSSVSHGMYAHQLTVDDYQALINRGWRRSGNFVYKPAMERTCCPPYTIRLDVNDFVPSKEQKAVLRRMERYLSGDLELNEIPREGSDACEPVNGGKAKGATHSPQLVRKGKRDRENPSLCGDGQRANPGESSPRDETGRECAYSGGMGVADGACEVRGSGEVAARAVGGLSPPAYSSAASPVEQIQAQVRQCVADLMGGPCPVAVAAKEVPQKLQKKLEKRKQEDAPKRDTMYTSNVAFVLAAHWRKEAGGNGASGAAHAEGQPPSVPLTERTAASTAEDKGVQSRLDVRESSPAAIAEGLAAEVRRRWGGAGQWRIEACGGHLNFCAPAGQLETEGGGARSNCATMSQRAEIAGRAGYKEAQPKKRKRFEMRMSKSKFDKEEYLLYRKYQIRVHNDAPHDISESSYRRFLLDSPLKAPPVPSSSLRDNDLAFCGFGSFHQQYRIDGRLIAVGVVDVLPQCLSSKYLFWDPDLAPLSLGKFSALKEIEWVRNAQRRAPALHYYYLGYYIHNCIKMRYKAAYSPSQLLCPVHYLWQPHSAARHVLDHRPYADLCHTATNADRTDGAKSEGAALPSDGEHAGKVRSGQSGRADGLASSDCRVGGKADGQSVGGLERAENGAEAGSPHSRGDKQLENELATMHRGDGAGTSDAAPLGDGQRQGDGWGSPVDGGEQEQGMLEVNVEGGLSADESDASDSESDMEDDVEGSGRAGCAAVSLEELGEVPLMLGGTVIPFRFFQQLGMLPPAALRMLLSRLRPYHTAVGPELANRLVYSLG